MLKIKSFAVAIASLLLCGNAFAQEVVPEQDTAVQEYSAPKERYTYLWDVTISMVGAGDNNPDIYDEVRDLIIKDMRSIPDNPDTEIYIVAFRGNLEGKGYKVWKGVAKDYSKDELAKAMMDFTTSREKNVAKNPDSGNTNTYTALKYAVDNIFTKDRVDYAKIMTDGGCDQKKSFHELLDDWCSVKERLNVYAYYITLTPKARAYKGELELHVDSLCFYIEDGLDAIQNVRQLNLINLNSEYNLMTDRNKDIVLKFRVSLGDGKIEPGMKIKCETDNSEGEPFYINQIVPFDEKGNTVRIRPVVDEYAQHNGDGFVKLNLSVVKEGKFKDVKLETPTHVINLVSPLQTLELDTRSVVCNVRKPDERLVVDFKCDNQTIKPGFKVNYVIEDPRGLISGSGTLSLDKNLSMTIVPKIHSQAKTDLPFNEECKGARIILTSGEEHSSDYKNVVFEECSCEIVLMNETYRKVKIYVE